MSKVLEEREDVMHCMAYVDLNAVSAGIVNNPISFPYCSIHHVVIRQNEGNLINLSFIHSIFKDEDYELEEDVRRSLGNKLDFLDRDYRKSYISYLAWVEYKRQLNYERKLMEAVSW